MGDSTVSAHRPFAEPAPGMRIKPGSPPLRRPAREEIESFPGQAAAILDATRKVQGAIRKGGRYDLRWVEGRHLLLVGATGAGLGGRLAMAGLGLLGTAGSLTVVARDLKRSIPYETGRTMQAMAVEAGFGGRFQWLNSGMALAGERLQEIVSALRKAGAERVIYVNTVAAASSGLLPGFPPVFVKDVDEQGIFQWELLPLDERSIEATRSIMGTEAVAFSRSLEAAGIGVEASVFADFRGSLDEISRDPSSPHYGRQGAYSTSLFLPKAVIQQAASEAYRTEKAVIDVFLPVMNTTALSMIPGGSAMYRLFQRLYEKQGARSIDVPELALAMLDRIGRRVTGEDDNPFPRLDALEASLDLHFLEVVKRLSADENSDFYYRRWI